MTVVVQTDAGGAQRIEAHLYKLIHVLRVEDITDRPAVVRDLALIKVERRPREPRRRSCSSPRSSARASSTSRRTSLVVEIGGIGSQDRRPARRAAAVRRARDGAHRPRRDGARRRQPSAGAGPAAAMPDARTACRISVMTRRCRTRRSRRLDQTELHWRLIEWPRCITTRTPTSSLIQRRKVADPRLRIAGARARAEPAGQRRRRARRPAGGEHVAREGAGGRPDGRSIRRQASRVGRRDHGPGARHRRRRRSIATRSSRT